MQELPGTRGTLSRNPATATRIVCHDQRCQGGAGSVPSGYRIAMPGESAEREHRAVCERCGGVTRLQIVRVEVRGV